jgi:hypothetical protein
MSRDLSHCFVKIPVKPLEDVALEKIRVLENKLGCQLIAFSKDNSEYAILSEEQMTEIEKLAEDIDAVIVAYNQRGRRPSPAC